MSMIRRKNGHNLKKLSFAGWVVAALVLLALAGNGMLGLFAPKSPPESREVASARRKLRDLEEATAAAAQGSTSIGDLDLMLVGGAAGSAGQPETAAGGGAPAAVEGEPALPVLTGIMKVVNVRGIVRYRAMFEGRDLGERDRVDGYIIQRISEAGVVLTRDGKSLTLPSPEVIYSLKQE